MNPTPIGVKARVLSLAIDEADDTVSLDVALGTARQGGLKLDEAHKIVGEVQAAVTHWRASATSHGLNARSGGQLLFPLISKLYEHISVMITTNLTFGE